MATRVFYHTLIHTSSPQYLRKSIIKLLPPFYLLHFHTFTYKDFNFNDLSFQFWSNIITRNNLNVKHDKYLSFEIYQSSNKTNESRHLVISTITITKFFFRPSIHPSNPSTNPHSLQKYVILLARNVTLSCSFIPS